MMDGTGRPGAWGHNRGQRWKAALVGGVLGGVLAVGLALAQVAQVAPGSRARVYPVPATGEAIRFQVPQVQLPNAVVARRISRQLLRFALAGQFATVDSTASPQRQLKQAVRACCYDAETKSWMAAGQGRTGIEYKVLLNQHYLLSVAVTTEYTNRHYDYETSFFTFDLRTGHLLTLADVLVEPGPRMRRRLQGAVNRRYQAQALDLQKTYSEPADTARLRTYLHLLGWNAATRHVQLDWPAVDTPGVPELREFALTPQALVLVYPKVGFSFWDQGEEPEQTYHFAYRSLRVRPLLAWTQAAKPAAAPAKQRSTR